MKESVVQRDPEPDGYCEHRLRCAVAEVVEEIGPERAKEILSEQWKELNRTMERERERISH